MTRRNAVRALAGGAAALLLPRKSAAQPFDFGIAPGPFEGTHASLAKYETPKWFQDAKFGIWAHWGPQSGIEAGDWYARNMYMQGSEQYNYHLAHYGHPSRVGYKDLVPGWHASAFDAERLLDVYRRAGAKYFVSMGVHHDNFDLWNSKYTRWNAVKMGPKKDVVGLFRKAALRHGMPFGVTEHLWITWKWFSTSKGSDKTGSWAGVPYDGTNPAYTDLYGDCKTVYGEDFPWNADGIPDSWRRHWYMRIKDLVDKYQPDLLYTDGPLPFEEYGLHQVANLYNLSAKRNAGVVQAVYTSKRAEDCASGTCVLDVERGVVDQIWPKAWQTDTSVGDWHYRRNDKYKSAKVVVDMLVDIVSRNGNLLLNFPLPNSGELDAIEYQILGDLTRWMAVNSEGIYGSRPWKIFGEGPSTVRRAGGGASFNEDKRKDLTAADVRFTTKGKSLYAYVMGWPSGDAIIRALGTRAHTRPGKIENVELLGYDEKVQWAQEATGLRVHMPGQKPSDHAIALKITGALA